MNQAQMIALVNALSNQAQGGQVVPGGVFDQMQDLVKSFSGVGYQTPLTPASGESYSPLVPQFLEPEVKIATVELQDEIVLWNDLQKTPARQTIMEYNRLRRRGQGMQPFFAEGAAPGNTATTWDKQFVRVTYLGRRGEVSDVANQIGLNGYVNQAALAVERKMRTEDLLLAAEASLFNADADINPLAFNGLIKQIKSGGGYNVDKGGAAVSFGDIMDYINTVASNENYTGKPTVVYADLETFGKLAKEAQESPTNYIFRQGVNGNGNNTQMDFGIAAIRFFNPRGGGFLELKAAPRLKWAINPPTAAEGTVGTAVTVAVQPVDDGALSGTSQWLVGDAGTYYYKVVPVYKNGQGAAITTSAVVIGAADKIKIEMNDASAQSNTDNPLYYYDVFRSSKDGAATTAKRIAQVAVNTDGAASGTRIVDLNATKYNSSRLIICDPYAGRKMAYGELLPVMLRPLAQTSTTVPFLVQMYGSPVVYVPEQAAVIENIVMS